ncbi:MAG: hypothetical protein O4808_12290, partial [Trichodesmium sp. St17_bin3_1_1]|nr:hypothetical protein [Trichodesmium sp. St17_bin3_1_1]
KSSNLARRKCCYLYSETTRIMARLEELQGAKIALDSVIFIYALEGNLEFGNRAIKIFEMIEKGSCQGFACDLVLAELMVKPLRTGEIEIAEEYANYISL